ncbi:hypothetical protein T459_16639 [Capsicum annuum]|uniref:[histone H3]-lysine(4) N-trimethyltransferase n=2 Tax=Capsicum annuum TaxID=4072 RepID=A0A2G2Z997_CAPAN|nr:hypothetical protein T459_16639 [Capsicum annuum]
MVLQSSVELFKFLSLFFGVVLLVSVVLVIYFGDILACTAAKLVQDFHVHPFLWVISFKHQLKPKYVGERIMGSVTDLIERRYRSQRKYYYFFRINDEVVIDATMKGNIARLINHSCMPNCFAKIMSLREDEDQIILIAKKDVSAEDELIFDYRFEVDQNDELKVPCLCGAPNCRKFMN